MSFKLACRYQKCISHAQKRQPLFRCHDNILASSHSLKDKYSHMQPLWVGGKKWSLTGRAWCPYFFYVFSRQKRGISVLIDGWPASKLWCKQSFHSCVGIVLWAMVLCVGYANCEVSRVFIVISCVGIVLWAVFLCSDYHSPGHSAIQINF